MKMTSQSIGLFKTVLLYLPVQTVTLYYNAVIINLPFRILFWFNNNRPVELN